VLRAVDGVSFEVSSGETLSIVGESGCGKTTTGRALLRLVDVTGGRVLFKGTDLVPMADEPLRRLRPHFQMVFQDPYGSLDPRLTVADAVAEPLRVHRDPDGPNIGQRVSDLLEMVGLPGRMAGRYPHQLSGGQRQRVAIARALALNPSLVVADEPTSALDVSVRAQILNLMQDLQEERGLTYVFISHDLSIVRHMSDRVAVMYLGKIVERAPATGLYAGPRHPYTTSLLSAVPVPDPKAQRQRIVLQGEVPSPAAPPPGCPFHPRCPHPKKNDRCRAEPPALREVVPGQFAACHFAEEPM
jgi:oligopeptide/dipeptide ABC transporter ATP-binding protein